jgi:hypothetical protein
MALGVDLFGLNAAGAVIWHRLCRYWDGHELLTTLRDRLQLADPEPSWECTLTHDEVKKFADLFDSPDMQSWFPNDPDLNELLQTQCTAAIRLRIEEWGYG